MKLDKAIGSSNPVAVGDVVDLQLEAKQDTAVITTIHERENYMVRASPQKHIKRQILAANIDQAVLLATLKAPVTSRGFLDRFLVTAAAYHIPAVLLFNKMDLYGDKERARLEEIRRIYGTLQYPVLSLSVTETALPDALYEQLKNKTSLLAGHSGVGKSSLINALLPERELKTQQVSQWSGKGMHTTTYAEMFDLPFSGKLIDTPGVREWGIVDIPPTELAHYFLDLRPFVGHCRFNNCLHIDEPGCAVKAAVVREEVDGLRYDSYCAILFSLQQAL